MSKGRTTWESIGGNNEDTIGGNSQLIKYENEKGETSALLIDAGSKFSEKDKTGYDTFLANVTPYLSKDGKEPEVKFDNFKMAVSHGHMDHIGALIHLTKAGYKLPEIVTSEYTKRMIQMDFAKKRFPKDTWPKITSVPCKEKVKVSDDMEFELIGASHSIPGARMINIETKDARILDTGDCKADQTLDYGEVTDFKYLEELSKKGIDALLIDSTSAIKDGATTPEADIKKQFIKAAQENAGKRLIVPTIASSMQRFASVAAMAAETDKTIILMGSQNGNWRILNEVYGADTYNGKRLNIVAEKDPRAAQIPPEQQVVVPTGTQAEETAAMFRAANGKHPFLEFTAGQDVVIPGQTIIPAPGNRERVEAMYNLIKNKGVPVLDPIHASGHGAYEDNKEIILAANKHSPKGHSLTVIPVHGSPEHLKANAKISHDCGVKSSIIPNANVVEISKDKGCKVVESGKDFTWIAVNDKNDNFMDPDYEYSFVDKNLKQVGKTIEYNAEKTKKQWDPKGKKGKKGKKGGNNKGNNFAQYAKGRGGR